MTIRTEIANLDIEFLHGVPVKLPKEGVDAIIAAIEKALPPEHENTGVPDENLNAQECGEVSGWNDYRDQVIALLREEAE